MVGVQAPEADFDAIVVGIPRVLCAEDLARKGIRVAVVVIVGLSRLAVDRSRGGACGMEAQAPDNEGKLLALTRSYIYVEIRQIPGVRDIGRSVGAHHGLACQNERLHVLCGTLYLPLLIPELLPKSDGRKTQK